MAQTYFFSSLHLLSTSLLFFLLSDKRRAGKIFELRIFKKPSYAFLMSLFAIVLSILVLIFPMQPASTFLADIIPAIFLFFSSIIYFYFYKLILKDTKRNLVSIPFDLLFKPYLAVSCIHIVFPGLFFL